MSQQYLKSEVSIKKALKTGFSSHLFQDARHLHLINMKEASEPIELQKFATRNYENEKVISSPIKSEKAIFSNV